MFLFPATLREATRGAGEAARAARPRGAGRALPAARRPRAALAAARRRARPRAARPRVRPRARPRARRRARTALLRRDRPRHGEDRLAGPRLSRPGPPQLNPPATRSAARWTRRI